MKKLNSLFIASAVAVSALAADAPAIHSGFVPKVDMFKFNPSLSAFKPQKVSRPVKGKYERNDDTRGTSPIEGIWTFIVGDNYFQGSEGFITMEFKADIDGNNVITFTDTENEFFKLVARYNPKTHSLNFSRRQIGEVDGSYVFQEPFLYQWEEGTLNKKSVLAYYNEYEDAIVFHDDLGIAWSSYSDAAGKDLKGYYNILDMSVCYHPGSGEWEELGEATFLDGWLAPGFGIASEPYPVSIEQNKKNTNLYRLVNPYKNGPMAESNECKEDGYIVFDLSDPDHVVFKFANAGYVNKEKGCSMFFVYNYLGTLALINPYYTVPEILQEIGNEYPFTTYKDGVLKFDNSKSLPDTRFGLQYPPTYGYYWKDQDGNPATASMNGGIAMPGSTLGISSFGIDNEGEVEYFNFQGLPVHNPEPGQILIKRQGSNVTKEVVR